MTRHAPAALVLVILCLAASVVSVSGDDRSRAGKISHMGSGFPDSYLALPIGRGVTVRICGAAACRTMTSNDVGPDQRQHPDRIADVSASTFSELCGLPPSAGLCKGHWSIVDDVRDMALPPTDTE
jgi:hypothetical protein